MRAFVKEPGHADRYGNLEIRYINHHNPDVVLLDREGREVQRIDLTRLSSTESMHKLMLLLGLREDCRDGNLGCADWARKGECDTNPAYMHVSCRKACRACTENATADGDGGQAGGRPCANASPEHDCAYWATTGECESNAKYMHEACRRSCGQCDGGIKCADESAACGHWAAAGQCTRRI